MGNRSSGPLHSSTIDLRSQSGVVAALAAIRASSLSVDEKNDLRDLVFLYVNGGGDQELRGQLENRLAHLEIPVRVPGADTTSELEDFGAQREKSTETVSNIPPATAPVTSAPVAAPVSEGTDQNTVKVVPMSEADKVSNDTAGAQKSVSAGNIAYVRPKPTFSAPKQSVSPGSEPIAVTKTSESKVSETVALTQTLADEVLRAAVAAQPTTAPQPQISTETVAQPVVQQVISPDPATNQPTPVSHSNDTVPVSDPARSPDLQPAPVPQNSDVEANHADVPHTPQSTLSAASPADVPAPSPAETTVGSTVVASDTSSVPSPNVVPTGSAPAVAVTPRSSTTTDVAEDVDYLTRIREIKSDVNKRVGNPVNLVDINNTVGREYMNALLEAMKHLNGGTSPEMTAAMNRLEQAYQSVLEALKKHEATDVSAVPSANEAEVSVSASSAQDTVATVADDAVSPVSDPVTPVSEPAVISAAHDVVAEAVPVEPPAPPTAVTPIAAAADVSPHTDDASVSVSKESPVPPAMAPVSAIPSVDEVVAPLDAQLESIPKYTDEAHADDPLMGQEVTAGLQQLLSEWSIFKSSGLFGTGPSGAEHPLYKQIAALPISLVTAGRYEGAKPEHQKSISDYMTGWRYERGIVEQPGEAFEHYLRRVVYEILHAGR